MTGLKLLADKVDARWMSRAAAGHAASIGIAGALSFALADLVAAIAGWRAAFLCVAATALLAFLLVALGAPRHQRSPAAVVPARALFDFRPVLRNRSAMAYALAYGFHTFEMSALRGWGVAFLGFVAAGSAHDAMLSPTMTLTILGLAGTAASVLGNEVAIRLGRRRLIASAMLASAACALLLGAFGARSYVLAVALMLAYGPIIWLDSASLTAGTAGTADPARRGATLAAHSMLGYIGGFIAPLAVGFVLDLGGGMSAASWAAVFVMIAVLGLMALAVFSIMRPRGLAGDHDDAMPR
jgi:predicted MFS family arabinose efflux permease